MLWQAIVSTLAPATTTLAIAPTFATTLAAALAAAADFAATLAAAFVTATVSLVSRQTTPSRIVALPICHATAR